MFEQNVFINCPFDELYRPLLRPMLFSILSFGLNPLISETNSSGNVRVNEIKKLIQTSRFSIHDISRNKPHAPGGFSRFNMPFEMGLDLGCLYFGGRKMKDKVCLILDALPYNYQEVVSDIAGQDLKDHNNDPQRLIEKLRSWFVLVLQRKLASPQTIWEQFTEFYTTYQLELLAEDFTPQQIDNIAFSEYIRGVKAFLHAG